MNDILDTKYISNLFESIYTKKIINYNGHRLKTTFLINIIDMFINRYLFFNKDNIKLNSRILKHLYGNNYSKYIDYLVENEFIYLYKNYSAGYRAKCYKLTDIAKQKTYLTANVSIPLRLKNKQDIMNAANVNDIDNTIIDKLIKDLYNVDIDINKTNEWINSNIDIDSKSYFVNTTNCEKILNKKIYYSFDTYGRFHTNYTTIKKEIRSNFLFIDNQPLKEIDITNSQPFFLYLMMKQSGFNNFNGFDLDVLNGVIYEKLREKSNNVYTRKEIKVNVYSVLFGRNNNNRYWNTLFKEVYPEVFEWIKNYKKENKSYKIIAQKLQAIESNFMFKTLIPKIIIFNKDIRLITVHDSILLKEEYYEDVKNIFNSCLVEIKNTFLGK